ncbi:RNA-dependent RNA polymerase family protein [Perilla frutescens var. frutescens]|nr:RNA-dependent RNA polymerase family protein [Perilla frutescens var. frutescens]
MCEGRAFKTLDASCLLKMRLWKAGALLSEMNKLEAVVAVDDANEVFSMKHLSMPEFENNIWDRYGSKFCKELDRSQYLDWDSGKTHIYYCEVSSNGSCIFKGPYLNRLRTHLQRSLGDDNVLIVKFSVDGEYSAEKIVEQGLLVDLRRFRFFVFKDERKKKHDQFATFGDAVRQERGAAARINEPPLLIQCRLFHDGYAVKGTLLLNRKLEPGRIQIRPSMIKVEKDQALQSEETLNSLEVVNISHRPPRNYLSKYLIALLSYGGVPQGFFLDLLSNALKETRNVYSNRRTALRVASLHDGVYWGFEAQRMICSGVPLTEPYLQHCLYNLEKGEKTKLKEGKLPVSESFYLMGTAADPTPTGVLNNDLVCVILDSGQISGKGLEDFFGNAKYGIFFSAKGQKSAAYEMATGDFDGDLYWISRNPEVKIYNSTPHPPPP